MIGLTEMVAIALCGLFVCVLLKDMHPYMAIAAAFVTCAILFVYSLNLAMYVMDYVRRLATRYEIADGYLQVTFKVIGIGYVCTLAAQLCRDAGQASVGGQVELFGKLLILVQALPIAAKLIDTLTGIL